MLYTRIIDIYIYFLKNHVGIVILQRKMVKIYFIAEYDMT